jgi:hypothetical protein
VRWYLAASLISGLGILGKSSLLKQFLHLPVFVILLLAPLSLCVCFFWPFVLRFRRIIGPACLLLLFIVFIFIFPRVYGLHKEGRGSDQSDCVIVASDQMIHGQWPYDRTLMESKDAMSCGPGWVGFQAPATGYLGYRWNLLLCWLVSAGVIFARLGWDRTAGLITLIALSPGTWLTAANGCDFLTFGIALAAFCVAFQPEETGVVSRLPWGSAIAALALGVIAQFRVPTVVIPGFFTRQIGRAAAFSAWIIATGVQVGFMVWNAHLYVVDGPLHVGLKLMRTAVVSDRPWIAIAEMVAGSAIGFVAVTILAERTRLKQPLLWFLWLLFLLPAIQNFILRFQQHGTLFGALEFWEGGMWTEACVPLAALGLLAATLGIGSKSLSPREEHVAISSGQVV